MPFSEDLWDGFEKVITKIVLNIQTCKDYADWFNKRAKIEKYYADYLNDLCKVHPGGRNASIDKQEKTLREAMLSVTEAGTRMGAKHLAAFNEILAQIVKPLETQIKHFEQEKKRLENDGKAKIKTQTDAVVSASKAHDAYVKACKDFEYNRDYHNKTEAELTAAPEAKRARIQGYLAKAVTKMQQSQDKAVAAENAYKVAVQAANDIQKRLHSELMPATLAELQKLAEDQFSCLEKAVKEFLTVQKTFPEELNSTIELITARTETELSWNNDLQEFIAATRTQATGPASLEFAAFLGKDGQPILGAAAPAPAAAAPAAEPAKPAEVAPAAAEPAPASEPERQPEAAAPVATEPASDTNAAEPGADLLDPLAQQPLKSEGAPDPVENLFS
eukprot:TRINITY_DN1957_c0_g2_i1.p1 TRINITY_DN1957_c0_g2~~TRINITY_DN1957_c0_g2_i1.p1  ORF type:complete len:390 (-),score=124.79 TRINITY_DN1957_c0_g2_i1:60-1229(-)